MTDSSSAPAAAGGRWRIAAAVVLLVTAAVCAVVLLRGPSGDDPSTSTAPGGGGGSQSAVRNATEALDALAATSAKVSASLDYSSIEDLVAAGKQLENTDPPSLAPDGVDVAETTEADTAGANVTPRGLPLEVGVVDFSAGTAAGDGGAVMPPSVVVAGTTYLDFSASPLAATLGVTGWVEVPDETAVGVDTNSTTLRALLDLVDSRDVWLGDTAEEGPEGTFTVAVDTDALAARDDERLAALDVALGASISDELNSGRRARAGSQMQVTVGDDGLPTTIRLEIVVAGQTATLTWDLTDFGAEVTASAPTDTVDYAEFSAAVAKASAPKTQTPGQMPPEVPKELEGAVAPAPDPAELPAMPGS